MLKEILEKQLSNLADRNVESLVKALNLLVIATYTITVVQLQKYIHVLASVIPSDSNLGLSEQILLTFISSILAVAGYFLLLEAADFLQEQWEV